MEWPRARWTNLPYELLVLIHGYLGGTRIAAARFRSVCRAWRNAVPRSTITTSISARPIPPIPVASLRGFHPFGFRPAVDAIPIPGLRRSVVYLLKRDHSPAETLPSPEWVLVQAVEGRRNGVESVKLLNPLTQRPFPHLQGKAMDTRGYHLAELCSGYQSFSPEVKKVVTFPDYEPWNGLVEEFLVLAVFVSGKLGYWRIGDENWTLIENPFPPNSYFRDIIIWRGKIYVCDYWGRLFSIEIPPSSIQLQQGGWNASSAAAAEAAAGGRPGLKLTRISASVHTEGSKKFLVKSDDGIYLVDRFVTGDVKGWSYDRWTGQDEINLGLVGFKVYSMNEAEHDWDEVKDLGDRVLVVVGDSAVMVSEKDSPGLSKRNCTYFDRNADDRNMPNNFQWETNARYVSDGGSTFGVFSLQDDSLEAATCFPGYDSKSQSWSLPSWIRVEDA